MLAVWFDPARPQHTILIACAGSQNVLTRSVARSRRHTLGERKDKKETDLAYLKTVVRTGVLGI